MAVGSVSDYVANRAQSSVLIVRSADFRQHQDRDRHRPETYHVGGREFQQRHRGCEMPETIRVAAVNPASRSACYAIDDVLQERYHSADKRDVEAIQLGRVPW